ncbi:uncharacterized protein EI90DRAFT_3055941 [Cantharellus anzutake]|uniref:uncharacterized protein n=1 Tax=Cantharellus anzutake TaxID=1750568 RepID=UPI0019076A65|nr:uncharacterized protein EI90DRAFT_3055941 [Cantharellus anzutake]KAF8331937.1 hypothetical protein EI90DRAFT_3055941 [Cantharellus anzutake]
MGTKEDFPTSVTRDFLSPLSDPRAPDSLYIHAIIPAQVLSVRRFPGGGGHAIGRVRAIIRLFLGCLRLVNN